MPRFERRAVDFLSRHMPLVLFGAAVLLSMFARAMLMPYRGYDVNLMMEWGEVLAKDGLAAIGEGLHGPAPHSVLLQLIYWLLTVVPLDSLTAFKLFSIAFDYFLALGVALIVLELRGDGKGMPLALAAFAVVLLLPPQLLNSAYWGQVDGVYSCLAVWAVLLLLRQRYGGAFVVYTLCFCLKLQAVFLLPLFVMLYFIKKSFSVLWFLLLPAGVFVTSLPAVFAGASPLIGFQLYLGQTAYNPRMFVNYPTLTALANNVDSALMAKAAIGLAALVLLAMLAFLLWKKRLVQGAGLVLLGAWCVIACVGFLPGMHERYGYLGEVLLWAWFFTAPSLKKLVLPVLFTLHGFFAYASFIFGYWLLEPQLLGLFFGVMFAGLTLLVVRQTAPAPLPTRGEEEPNGP